MLSENGLSLAGSTVGDARDERADSETRGAAGPESADDDGLMTDDTDTETVQVVRTDVSGLVDTFV